MGELDGRVAVVTGAARGQGRAIARRFVVEGAHVVGGDVLEDELASLTDELGDAVTARSLDVRDRGQWDALVAGTVEAHGHIDVLVNNAAVHRNAWLTRETAESFEAVWRVNTLGPFHGIQAVVAAMDDGGAIVNTLSTAALHGFARNGAYAASKGALAAVTRVAAIELASRGIRVNAVVPGGIDTPMVLAVDDPVTREALTRNPLGRIGEPGDVADAVLYLASDRAAFVTGTELVVDGGMLAGVPLPPRAPS